MHSIVNWLWVFGVAALLFAWYKATYVNRKDTGTDRMAEISSYIREGAIAFEKRDAVSWLYSFLGPPSWGSSM